MAIGDMKTTMAQVTGTDEAIAMSKFDALIGLGWQGLTEQQTPAMNAIAKENKIRKMFAFYMGDGGE